MVKDARFRELLGRGNTAEIYAWEADKVIKLYRENFPVFYCEKEFINAKNVHEHWGICPRAYGLVSIDGRTGLIFEKISGRTMMEEMLRHLLQFKSWSKRLAQYHLMMQQKVEFEMSTVKEMLSERIGAVAELSCFEKEYLLRYIDGLPDGDQLCHFDFHPDNIMIADDKPVIIDWMNACSGEPLSDAARTTILLKYSHIPHRSKFIKSIMLHMRLRVYGAYIKEYLTLSNRDIADIERWELPVMAARLYESIPPEEKLTLLELIRQRIH